MYIKKQKNGKFIAEVRKKGFYKSKTFSVKNDALRWALDIENQLDQNCTYFKNKTLKELLLKYKDEITISKKSANKESQVIKRLSSFPISNIKLENLSARDFKNYVQIRSQSVKNSTINRELNIFSAAFSFGIEIYWINKNPLHKFRRPKNPPHRDRRISDIEKEKILKALSWDESAIVNHYQQLAAAFILALETAMRQGEIFNTTWNNVDLNKRVIYIPDSKNSYPRFILLSKKAVSVLQLLKTINGESQHILTLKQTTAAQLFRRTVKLCQIENLTFHDCRHEAVSNLAKKLDILQLSKMVGHRDPRSLSIYYNPRPEELVHLLD